MKLSFLKVIVLAAALTSGLATTSCKGKSKDATESTAPTTTTQPAPTAPVEVAPDNALETGVKDATKDFPGVTATVNNGEVTLTGNIRRSRLTTLMQSLQSLKPKKINNNLNIQ